MLTEAAGTVSMRVSTCIVLQIFFTVVSSVTVTGQTYIYFIIYFITLQLVLVVPCGGGRTSPCTSP